MTTTDLTKKLAERLEISQRESRDLLRLMCDTIARSLTHKETVILRGFGSFGTRTRAPKKFYNPAAKSHMLLPPKEVVFFRPSQRLKDSLAERSEES